MGDVGSVGAGPSFLLRPPVRLVVLVYVDRNLRGFVKSLLGDEGLASLAEGGDEELTR